VAPVFRQQLEQGVRWAVRLVLAVRLTLAAMLVVQVHQFILVAAAAALVMERQGLLAEQAAYMVAAAVEVGLLQTRWVVLVKLALLLLPTRQ